MRECSSPSPSVYCWCEAAHQCTRRLRSMIAVEGRVIPGLDEFMLRTGHLRLVCRTAWELGGSTIRMERETAERVAKPVPVAADRVESLARYLLKKRLCAIETNGSKSLAPIDDGEELRYPDLMVVSDSEGSHS